MLGKLNKKITQEDAYNRCYKLGFELLDSYSNCKTKLNLKCFKHNEIYKANLNNIWRGRKLLCCKREKTAMINKLSLEEAKNLTINIGFELLSDTWLGTRHGTITQKYMFRCLKHNEIYECGWDKILKNKSIKCCWLEKNKELGKKYSGNKSHFWNPNLSDKERGLHRNGNMKSWAKKIKKNYNNVCQYCLNNFENSKLHAHHIENYSSNKNLRYEINNGFLFCSKHHVLFHKIYGQKDNNMSQINDFLTRSK